VSGLKVNFFKTALIGVNVPRILWIWLVISWIVVKWWFHSFTWVSRWG